MIGDRALAEDLAQDTFVKAFGRLDTFDPARKFSNWLLKIAHNTAIDSLRRTSPDVLPLDVDNGASDRRVVVPAGPEAERPDRRFERQALGGALESALARLRPEYREVVVLRYHEGLAYGEIADVLGIPIGTVKTHVHRARKELAGLLQAAGWAVETRPAGGS